MISTIFLDALEEFDNSDFDFALASTLRLSELASPSVPAPAGPAPLLPSSFSPPAPSAMTAIHETVERDPLLDQAIPRDETTSPPQLTTIPRSETTRQSEPTTTPCDETTDQPRPLEAPS